MTPQETNDELVDMVAAIDRRTLRMEVALFGSPGQEWMGHISQNEVRLSAVEGKIWKAVVGTLIALVGVVWQWLSGHLP